MKRGLIAFLLSVCSSLVFSQIVLTIEGTEFNDTISKISGGVNIPRTQRTLLTFRNNSITAVNAVGYLLQAGDEFPGLNNNNLDGEIITGNRFIWNGTDETSMTHALFTGYNLDVIIKYNYLYKTPNGIQRKSDGMTDEAGVIAYNIINNPKVGIVVKGMNGVRIFNNTLYCERSLSETSRGLIDIHKNTDGGLNAASTGIKIFNNIFYTKYETLSINVLDQESLVGLESDYNIFYCETGSPRFNVGGALITFQQWQALGYDIHSIVVNPKFKDFTDFIPQVRLDHGKTLGKEFQTGLSTTAIWGKTDPETTEQGIKWQVGARIHEAVPDKKIAFYPNPVSDFFNISINDLDLTYRIVKIFDLQGRMLHEELIVYGLNTIEIPRYISSGMYNIALESDNLKRYIGKIMIVK
ncbi:MAG: T9SS type A sorting domain-containing protein [Prolixibacteraceae bacterium]|nr:T9SS type A sorting domain-containing protein [Prolixibacteraceae bacterium]